MRASKRGTPHKRSLFYRCRMVRLALADSHRLVAYRNNNCWQAFKWFNINDLERPWTTKIGGFGDFLQFSAAAHISTVKCNEMDWDRLGQPTNRNCYIGCRASHELCSNYLSFCVVTLVDSSPLNEFGVFIDWWIVLVAAYDACLLSCLLT